MLVMLSALCAVRTCVCSAMSHRTLARTDPRPYMPHGAGRRHGVKGAGMIQRSRRPPFVSRRRPSGWNGKVPHRLGCDWAERQHVLVITDSVRLGRLCD